MPQFYANLVFLMLINLLVKPLYVFGIDRKVQVVLAENGGGGSYGLYFALFNFSYLFYMLLDLGLTEYNRRAVAREPGRLGDFLPAFLAAKLLLVFAYLALLFAGAWAMGYGVAALRLLVPLAGMQVFLSLLLYFRSNLGGLHRFRLDGFFSVLDRLLMIALGAALLYGDALTVERFAWAQALSYAISATACGLVVWLLVRGAPKSEGGALPDRQTVAAVFRESLPFALLALLMTLYGRVDSIFLERLLPEGVGAREADIFARGFRLFDALQNFALLFGHLVAPMFARMVQQNQPTEPLVKQSFGALWAFSATAGIACFFYREPLYALLYEGTAHGPNDALVLGLLLLAFCNISAVYVFGGLLAAGNHLRALNGIALGALVLNLLLNLWLVPRYLALGAAVAAFCTQALSGMAHLVCGVYLMRQRLSGGYWARMALHALGSAALFFGAVHLGGGWALFVAALAGAGLLALVTGAVSFSRDSLAMLKR